MQNRTPVARSERAPVPDFAPVPRRNNRHDGWTPGRQKAFIEALADTGCVTRAAGMVNMAQTNCYALRRAPGAEEFRRAWDAALDFGLGRIKDIAFERAIEGQLVPVFVAGKLMGFRRKKNDALLMFLLRHYGQDASGRRTTINYFSTRASAGASAGEAQASATTVRTIVHDAGENAGGALYDDRLAGVLEGFAGVTLDAEAEAAIMAAIAAAAQRQAALDAAIEEGGEARADALETMEEEPFIRQGLRQSPWRGELVPAMALEFVDERWQAAEEADAASLPPAPVPEVAPEPAPSAPRGGRATRREKPRAAARDSTDAHGRQDTLAS